MSTRAPTRILLLLAGVAVTTVIVLLAYNVLGDDRSTPTERIARRAVAECRKKPESKRTECFAALLKQRLGEAGAGEALATLQAIAIRDPDVDRDGHVYAHGIGIELYQQDTVAGRSFSQCTMLFSSGCYHGVVQAYLEHRAVVDAATLADLCRSFRGTASQWMLFQCVHGMGHGLSMFYGHDLPRALVACDLLSGEWDRESCYGGAFMENVMHATMPDHPASVLAASHQHHSTFQPLDPKDLQYPCSIVGTQHQRACYLMQTSVMLYFNKGDIAGAARVCDQAPIGSRPTCYQSLGRDITSYALRDPDKSLLYCLQGSADYRGWCYVGVTKALVDWSAKPATGLDFCGRVARGRGWAECYRAVGEEVAALSETNAERAAHCRGAGGAEAVRECRIGALLPADPPP